MPEQEAVNVVWEYNELAGSYRGGRFITEYQTMAAAQKASDECKKEGSDKQAIAIGIPFEEAQVMCQEALLKGDFLNRRMTAIAGSDMPKEMQEMEAAKLLFAARFGPKV